LDRKPPPPKIGVKIFGLIEASATGWFGILALAGIVAMVWFFY
jgi:hypothetical protein